MHAREPLRRRAEKRVAGRMSERVVDLLEVVEVEAHHRQHRPARRQFLQRLLNALAEGIAIGQVGEPVMARHVGDARLRAPLLGHVLERRHPVALRHRLLSDSNDTLVRAFDLEAGGAMAADVLLELVGDVGRHVTERELRAEAITRADACLRVDVEEALELRVLHDRQHVAVEHAQPLRHVVERRVEQRVLFLQRVLLLDEKGVLIAQPGVRFLDGTFRRREFGRGAFQVLGGDAEARVGPHQEPVVPHQHQAEAKAGGHQSEGQAGELPVQADKLRVVAGRQIGEVSVRLRREPEHRAHQRGQLGKRSRPRQSQVSAVRDLPDPDPTRCASASGRAPRDPHPPR